jgi:hypothetical protein
MAGIKTVGSELLAVCDNALADNSLTAEELRAVAKVRANIFILLLK